MTEITIEIRPGQISIQGDNIAENKIQALRIIQAALAALESAPAEVHQNEIIFTK